MLHYHSTSVPESMRAEQGKNLHIWKNQSALSFSLTNEAFFKVLIIWITWLFTQIAFCVFPRRLFLKNHFHNCIFKTPALRILVALAITLQSLSVITADTLNGNDSSRFGSPHPLRHLIKSKDSVSTHPQHSPHPPTKKNTYTKTDKYLKFEWHLRGLTNVPKSIHGLHLFHSYSWSL